MQHDRPLHSTRVVELGTSIAGPYCGLILAALGAEVVKIEPPAAGDDTRGWGPPFWHGESPAYLAVNAGKRSLAVDLRDPRGVDLVAEVTRAADVVVQNLRPGLAERLGLGFEPLAEANPRLVYCTIGSFGASGPLSADPGYDPLMQAAAGIMSITGEPERPPARAGPSIVDQGAGMWAALAILGALRLRDAGHGAQLVETSLYETAVNWVPYQLLGYLASGTPPRPAGSGISILAPYEAFRVADGWVMIAVGNDRLFRKLCEGLGAARLLGDERYRTNADRVRHRAALAAEIATLVGGFAADDLLEMLRGAGVPAAPVLDLAGVAQSAQTEALGLLQPLPTARLPELRLVAPPVSLNGRRLDHRTPPPKLGEHSLDLLGELGYDADSVASLVDAGVIWSAGE